MYRHCHGNTVLIAFLLLLLALPNGHARAIDTERPDVKRFVEEVSARHGMDRELLEGIIAEAKSQTPILELISRPAERVKPWYEYRAIFLTPERIEAGIAFWREHESELARISAENGVAPEILVGIIGVETYFGRITGNYRVLDALATLAFDYPPRRSFFRRELEQFLLLVREEGLDARSALGSYAGAMGAPQFMPSSYRAYAVDASDDGARDLFADWSDIIGSVANYFVEHGWRSGEAVFAPATTGSQWSGQPAGDKGLETDDTVAGLAARGIRIDTDMPAEAAVRFLRMEGADEAEYWAGFHNFHVITRYNRSAMYALAVWQLGAAIAEGYVDANN